MDPLAQLHDIQTPQGVDWWPLAWGWWVVAILVIAVIVAVTYSLVRHIKFNRARRDALRIHHYLALDSHYPALANQLLKRVTLHYFEPAITASVFGKSWIALLQNCLSAKRQAHTHDGLALLVNSSYQQQSINDEHLKQMQAAVKYWLENANLKRPPVNNAIQEASANV